MLNNLFNNKYICNCADCKNADRCQSTGNTETYCPLGYKPKWMTKEMWDIIVDEIYSDHSDYDVDNMNEDAILNIILEEASYLELDED